MADRQHPHHDEIVSHLAEVMHLLGLDAEVDAELMGTPARVARLWAEWFSGVDPQKELDVRVLAADGDQEDMIMVRDLPFWSICAHHFTPFFGLADVAYIPGERLIGVGTPAQVIHHYSRRPQIQERLGEMVCTRLTKAVEPRGVMVHMTARHMCMEMRGARSPGFVETTATRGWFSDQEWRMEFFDRLGRRPRL